MHLKPCDYLLFRLWLQTRLLQFLTKKLQMQFKYVYYIGLSHHFTFTIWMILFYLLFLQVPLDQVETWVVKALNTDLLDAKINQPTQTINVTRSIQREFTAKHWENLQENLQKWISVVDGVLEVVEGTQKTA